MNDKMISEINDFLEISNICLYEYFDKYIPSQKMIVPYLVNTIFCIELCLKFLLNVHGNLTKGHSLTKLFSELQKKDGNLFIELNDYFQKAWCEKCMESDKDITLLDLLERYDVYFEKVRYLYEDTFNYSFTIHYPNISATILRDFCVKEYRE